MRSVIGVGMLTALLAIGMPALGTSPDETDLEEGKVLFQTDATPACAVCHTLKDAEATGNIGPDLDDLQPARNRIIKAMQEGTGPMPSFSDSLSDEQMAAIADYVVYATGQ